MRISVVSTLIAVAFVGSILHPTDGEGASLRQIRRMIERKEYAEARVSLTEQLPSLRGGERVSGMLLLAGIETDMDRAVDLYTEVIAAGGEKEKLTARLEKAKILYAVGDYREVTRVLAGIDPKFRCDECFESIYLRGLAFRQLGESALARREFEKVDRGEYLEWSYIALAELDMQEGRVEQAIDRYETIGGSHSNPVAGFKLGECYEILGERSKAGNAYRTVAHQFPRSLETPRAAEKLRYLERRNRSNDRAGGGEARDIPYETGSSNIVRGPGFTLQLGAFSERENAIRLAEELGQGVSDVRVERAEFNGKIWHRVRIGVFESRSEAEREAARLERLTRHSFTVLPLDL
jgi:tetratricopeptide (TPR) repeat protein